MSGPEVSAQKMSGFESKKLKLRGLRERGSKVKDQRMSFYKVSKKLSYKTA